MTKGEKIKQLRERLGMSQVELAKKIGISKQTLYKYENDIITNIPSDNIEKIARALDSSPAEIMGWNRPADIFAGSCKITTISEIEEKILRHFRLLNEEGRKQFMRQLHYLVTDEDYTRKRDNYTDSRTG